LNTTIPYIKICGLTDPILAYAASKLGANYIGIIFHKDSKRFVDVDTAKEIAASTKGGGAMPVAVFVNHTAVEMEDICSQTGIEIVQLHGALAREQHHYLADNIQRIYVLHVDVAGKIVHNNDHQISKLNKHRDAVLFDNTISGSGNLINTREIKFKTNSFNTFIAGGINKHNVDKIINECNPYGIDISTGVEDAHGIKRAEMISEFIETVNYEVHDDE